jgi:hypothetical protein
MEPAAGRRTSARTVTEKPTEHRTTAKAGKAAKTVKTVKRAVKKSAKKADGPKGT